MKFGTKNWKGIMVAVGCIFVIVGLAELLGMAGLHSGYHTWVLAIVSFCAGLYVSCVLAETKRHE